MVKRCLLLLLVLVLLPQVAFAEPGPCESMAKTWAEAVEKQDFDAVKALYAATDDFIALESTGDRRQGQDGLDAMWADAAAEVTFEGITLRPLAVTERETFAICVGELEAISKPKKGEGLWILEVQGTWVLENSDQGWRIVHEHFSPIKGVERVRHVMAKKKHHDKSE